MDINSKIINYLGVAWQTNVQFFFVDMCLDIKTIWDIHQMSHFHNIGGIIKTVWLRTSKCLSSSSKVYLCKVEE